VANASPCSNVVTALISSLDEFAKKRKRSINVHAVTQRASPRPWRKLAAGRAQLQRRHRGSQPKAHMWPGALLMVS